MHFSIRVAKLISSGYTEHSRKGKGKAGMKRKLEYSNTEDRDKVTKKQKRKSIDSYHSDLRR
jgi:hypothetical protein